MQNRLLINNKIFLIICNNKIGMKNSTNLTEFKKILNLEISYPFFYLFFSLMSVISCISIAKFYFNPGKQENSYLTPKYPAAPPNVLSFSKA